MVAEKQDMLARTPFHPDHSRTKDHALPMEVIFTHGPFSPLIKTGSYWERLHHLYPIHKKLIST